MALTPQEIKDLKANFKRAQKNALSFFYCLAGPDGDPVLVIKKQINADKKRIRAEATKKIFVEGKVRKVDGAMAFVVPDPKKGKLALNLAKYFGKAIPEFKKAKVLAADVVAASQAGASSAAETTAAEKTSSKRESKGEKSKLKKAVSKMQPQFEANPRDVSDADLKGLGSLLQQLAKAGDSSRDGLAKRARREVRYRKRIRAAASEVKASYREFQQLRDEGGAALKALQGKPGEVIAEWDTHIDAVTRTRDRLAKRVEVLRETLASKA